MKNDTEEQRFEEERAIIHRQMLSAVSHDLKTPLAAIIGSLEICDRMSHLLTPEKNALLISTALTEAYRLDNFISNILDIAKLENGMVKAQNREGSIESMLKECMTKSRFSEKKIDILPIAPQLMINTDPILFCRVISLLLDNAIKYNTSKDPQIWIKAWKDDQLINVQVRDNGPGIPPGKDEEIFSKYTRIKHGDHQNAGTGLGLAIGRAIASLLNARLYAGNREEGGAIFTLELPVK